MSKFTNFFRYNDFNAEKSVTSWFTTPKILLIIRGIISLYTWIILIDQFVSSLIYDGPDDFFKFFTNYSYVGLTAYFTTAFYRSYRYVTKNCESTSFRNQPNILNWLFWLLYHTIVHFPILLTLFYWLFLYNEELNPFEWWIIVSMHGFNSLFVIIEVFLNRQIMSASFIILNLTIQILYTFIVYINYAVTSHWVYEFMDFTKGIKSALWYIGLIIGSTLIFFIMYGIHLLRDYLGKRFGRYNILILI
ncbi:hypothetical protein RCL_jg19572.t1 [Rhizophagus clarus]|uniref:Uncharacterized protein n=1 Tax=Rhizophagus clarus TaxID=94130 RepID=A0A8H3L8Z0_9GLOM|nr:hypothetical protein RCL_jg19572.t1 [Rhizophagus clarus]